MKVEIDRSGCISCGLCADTCPEVFRMDDDGLAEVYAQPEESQESAVEEAAEGCPVSVISAET
ncbi:MAG: ferredoxin [Clostridia bacterium]|nr:ferredoxin [Clostridia bacterium]